MLSRICFFLLLAFCREYPNTVHQKAWVLLQFWCSTERYFGERVCCPYQTIQYKKHQENNFGKEIRTKEEKPATHPVWAESLLSIILLRKKNWIFRMKAFPGKNERLVGIVLILFIQDLWWHLTLGGIWEAFTTRKIKFIVGDHSVWVTLCKCTFLRITSYGL